MGRAKLAMEYIKKDKARSTTFVKRKKGLFKKANELATLCDVPLCVLIYPSGQNSVEPETYPLDQAEVRSVVYRYLSVPKEEIAKRSLDLEEALVGKKKTKVDDHHQDSSANAVDYPQPNCFPQLDLHGLSREQLVNLVSDLDSRLNAVQERINAINEIYNANAISANSLVSTNAQMDHQMQWLMCGGTAGFDFDPTTTSGYSGGQLAGYNDFNTVPNFHYGPVGPSHQNSGFGGAFYTFE